MDFLNNFKTQRNQVPSHGLILLPVWIGHNHGQSNRCDSILSYTESVSWWIALTSIAEQVDVQFCFIRQFCLSFIASDKTGA